nr:hypothetical protein [Sulfitobacter faviae]
MHAAEAGNVLAVLDLAKRFMAMRDRVAVLVTLSESAAAQELPTPETRDLFIFPAPANTPTMWRGSLTTGGPISACGHGAG